jgi:hypothetical protein
VRWTGVVALSTALMLSHAGWNQVKQLASIIGQCYDVPESETTPGDDEFVFIRLPNAVSIYVDGTADMVAVSIGVANKGRFDNAAGRSTGESGDGTQPPDALAPPETPASPAQAAQFGKWVP